MSESSSCTLKLGIVINSKTKVPEFDKAKRDIIRQLKALNGYSHVARGIERGESESSYPPFDIKSFNARMPPYTVDNVYGLNEDEYNEMRAALLTSAIKRHDGENVAATKANKRAFAAICLLCDDNFLTTLEGLPDYAKINLESNPVALMKLIESLAYREGKPRNEECITALLHSRSLFSERRGKGRQRKSLENYVFSMKAKYQVCLNSGHDTCATFTEMLKDIERFGKNEISLDQLKELGRQASEKKFARLLIANCEDYHLHNHLITSWNQTHDDDLYPNTSERAIELMHTFDIASRARNNRQRQEDPSPSENDVSNTGTATSHHITSVIPPVETHSSSRTSHILAHNKQSKIPKSWVLLDTCADISLVNDKELMGHMEDSPTLLKICSDGGVRTVSKKGSFVLCNDLEVWFDKDAVANVLCYADIKRLCKIKTVSNGFTVTWPNDSVWKFTTNGSNIYHYDRKTPASRSVNVLSTVRLNKTNFTKRDVQRADEARELEAILAYPSMPHLRSSLENNCIANCPITSSDVLTSNEIFGPSPASLAGKTTRKPSITVPLPSSRVPITIEDRYKRICVCADVLIINGLKFVTTIVPTIKHATVTMIDKAEERNLWDAIKPILQLYQLRGFQVSEFRADGQFACLQRVLLASGVPNIRICSRDEHEPFIERHHRILQERARALLFQSSDRYQLKSFPKKVIQGVMRYATFFTNALPAPSGISKTLSPAAMMNDYFLDYSKHCRLQFMQYVLIHNESKNNLNPRVSHALNLGPTGDAQGNHLFLNIETNKIVKRLCNKWTVTPMPDNVPGMIHRLATADKMPEGISFNLDIAYDSDDCDDPIGFDDPSYIPNPIDALDLTLSDDVEPIGVTELSDLQDDANNANDMTDANDVNDDDLHSSSISNESLSNDTTDLSNSDDLSHDFDDTAHDNLGNVHGSTCSNEMIHQQNDDTISAPTDAASLATDDDKSGSNEEDGVTIADVAAEMDALYGERNHNYGLRPRSKRSYGHLFSQMGFKAGLKKFGKKAENAVNKEFFQLNAYDCVEPRSDLTAEQRRKALEYIMTIKKKRNGTIKGRGCADGRKQRAYLIKDEVSSPTVSLDTLFLSIAIDSFEGRDVATVDVPGAFLQTELKEDDEEIFMVLRGKLAELLCKQNPSKYDRHLKFDRKNKEHYIYVRLKEAVYGTLQAALRFWEDLSSHLEKNGFKRNPHDWCCFNKMVKGKQAKILFHVDDIKISHIKAKVVTDIIKDLSKRFGKLADLTIQRGHIHEYVGIKFDFSEAGKVKVDMRKFIDDIAVTAHPELLSKSRDQALTPAADDLFNIDPDSCALNSEKAECFHTSTAKLLFIAPRARPDMSLAVSFLCTRVKQPTEQDWIKLSRALRYLVNSKDLLLTIQTDDITKIHCHVDAAHMLHHDLKGHMGGRLSLGKGALCVKSKKLKLNTLSSCESELVGASEYLKQLTWAYYFLRAQGFPMSPSVLYQDNQSTIKLINNGRRSSSSKTKHIDSRFFYT